MLSWFRACSPCVLPLASLFYDSPVELVKFTQTVFEELHGNTPAEKVMEADAQFLKHRIRQPRESFSHLLLIGDAVLLNEHLPEPSPEPQDQERPSPPCALSA